MLWQAIAYSGQYIIDKLTNAYSQHKYIINNKFTICQISNSSNACTNFRHFIAYHGPIVFFSKSPSSRAKECSVFIYLTQDIANIRIV